MSLFDYEKLGAFYLGREYDPGTARVGEAPLMYDAKDLCTHGVIVGMTGSGKTGLGITLLEEAAIDGIPAIIIDPKGDMGNLLLSFPSLAPRDFEPYVEPGEALRKGMTTAEFAADQAKSWKTGLANWDQPPERIQRFREAADVALYTPGSETGIPLSLLRSFAPPKNASSMSVDMLREQVSTAVSGLLALVGIDADPIRSREHILLTNIVDHAWQAGRGLELSQLIREIQNPPFQRIGVMSLETVFPAADRMGLAMTLNNILGSPKFQSWMQGEPLDVQRLLYSPSGKPRLAVLSIAHLSDQERMFFVTLLLNAVISWMRQQSGTSSLRALLYMDEVFGYLPPTANPPSKVPMLTLLKQARAFGLGLLLATQNPVDLDYKALSNAGTWFLGRLQTERDKLRVLDGLEGASTASGLHFQRDRVEKILSGLANRVFLMNNVHDNQPTVFQTRWALSYLRGPLSREQIQSLTAPFKIASVGTTAVGAGAAFRAGSTAFDAVGHAAPPVLPPDVPQRFAAVGRSVPRDAKIVYRPSLLGTARVHFVDSKAGLDHWKTVSQIAELDPQSSIGKDPWSSSARVVGDHLEIEEPLPEAQYADCPAEFGKITAFRSWATSLKAHAYQHESLELNCCPELKLFSSADDREADFKGRLALHAREVRDLEVQKLQRKFESKLKVIQDQLQRAEDRVAKEQEQANSSTMSAMLSFGTTIAGALFGRKKLTATNVSKAATSMRSATRASEQRGDVGRAKKQMELKAEEMQELEDELELELQKIKDHYDETHLTIEAYPVSARKSDTIVEEVAVLWLPYRIDAGGDAVPAFDERMLESEE